MYFPLVLLIFLVCMCIPKTCYVEGNIVVKSKDLCSVPEIGVYTTSTTAFFVADTCNSTAKCSAVCVKLDFKNGTCTKKSESLNDLSITEGCTCWSDEPVMLTGRETAGNYQLNNWTFYWTGCRGTRPCQALCNEGNEEILDALCLPWPKNSRICACKPVKPMVLTSVCGNTDAADELPEEEQTQLYFDLRKQIPGYYTKTRIAVNAALLAGWEILGQIIVILLS